MGTATILSPACGPRWALYSSGCRGHVRTWWRPSLRGPRRIGYSKLCMHEVLCRFARCLFARDRCILFLERRTPPGPCRARSLGSSSPYRWPRYWVVVVVSTRAALHHVFCRRVRVRCSRDCCCFCRCYCCWCLEGRLRPMGRYSNSRLLEMAAFCRACRLSPRSRPGGRPCRSFSENPREFWPDPSGGPREWALPQNDHVDYPLTIYSYYPN